MTQQSFQRHFILIVHHFNRDFVEVAGRDKHFFNCVLCIAVCLRSSMCWDGWQEEKKDDVFDYQECRYFILTTQSVESQSLVLRELDNMLS